MHEEQRLTIGEVVAELQPYYPDLTISSLRFLEREGLVAPQRTIGGHRLFTARDIEQIRLIKDLQRRRYSLEEIRHYLRRASKTANLHDLTEDYMQLILAGERAQALQLIMRTVLSEITTEQLYLHVITPAMTRIGEMWRQGIVSVAQEHLASSISRDALALLKEHLTTRPANGLRAVAACPPGELHELGLRVAADLFESAGWRVAYLGANTPIETLLDYMAQQRPDLLLLSVGSEDSLLPLAELIAAVRQRQDTLGHVVVGLGGPGMNNDLSSLAVGADFVAERADEAIATATALVMRRRSDQD